MPFQNNNGIHYYSFENLAGVTHAVFTRRGGVSPSPWDSLNVGGSVGDDPAHVRANRVRSFDALGRDPASIHDVWLVHGTNVVHADAPRDLAEKPPQADIVITDNPKVTLFMRYADCVPLLFHDPKKGVVALAHAGWLGTVRGVATATLEAMHRRYGTDLRDVRAAIGPAIGPDHYEIGADVAEQIRAAFPGTARHYSPRSESEREGRYGARAESLLEPRGERFHLDLWKANRLQMEEAGVAEIETAEICTACHLDDWFSHRAEQGKTGRFGALIGL
jgi:YfiH family protein